MNLNELNELASLAKSNEEVITNKTDNLKEEARRYVLEEFVNICAEEKKLIDFVNANGKTVCDKCGTPYLGKFGLCYTAKRSENPFNSVPIFTFIGLDNEHLGYYNGVFETCFPRFFYSDFCMDGDIEYWTYMKSLIDFRRWNLNETAKKLKELICWVITDQRNRMNKIVKVCEDIDKENEPKSVSVTITISK